MKTLVLFGILSLSLSSFAACRNFSGEYKHQDSARPLTLTQIDCAWLTLDDHNGEPEMVELDGVKRIVDQDDSLTSWLTGRFVSDSEFQLIYDMDYHRPPRKEQTAVSWHWLGSSLRKEIRFYMNGRLASEWTETYLRK